MKWVTIKDIRFFNDSKDYLYLNKNTVLEEVYYSNQNNSIKSSIKNQKYKNPNKRFICVYFKGKQRILEIGKSVIPYSSSVGNIPKRKNE